MSIQLIRKVAINAFQSPFDLILTPIWKNNCNEKFDCGDYCIDKSNVCDGVISCPKDEISCEGMISHFRKKIFYYVYYKKDGVGTVICKCINTPLFFPPGFCHILSNFS